MTMAQGNGAFVIAELCNRIGGEGTREERRLLQRWFTESGISKSIQDMEIKGKGILLQSIDTLLST